MKQTTMKQKMIGASLALCMCAAAGEAWPIGLTGEPGETRKAVESLQNAFGMSGVFLESEADPLIPMVAVTDGNFQNLRDYVYGEHGNVNVRLSNGMSLLEVAVRYGGDDVVAFLMAQGAEVRKRDGKGNSLATLAAWQDRPEVMKMLLNASPEPPNLEEIWLKLVELPVDPCIFYMAGDMTRVMQHHSDRVTPPSLRMGDRVWDPVRVEPCLPKNIRVLLEQENNGPSAAPSEARHPRVLVLRELLERGVDMGTRRSSDGATALHAFIYERNPEIIKLLLSFRADVNARDAVGRTPLMYAAGFRDMVPGSAKTGKEIIRLLLNAGADVNAQDNNGKTALMYAVDRNLSENAELLLLAGADPEMADAQGNTALMIYAGKSSPCLSEACVEALCARTAWGRHDKVGQSVFSMAVRSGNIGLLSRIGDAWEGKGITPEDVYRAVVDTVGNSPLGEDHRMQVIEYLLPQCNPSVIGHAWVGAEFWRCKKIADVLRGKMQDIALRGKALSGVVRWPNQPFSAEKLDELMRDGVDEKDVLAALWAAAAVDNGASVKYLLARGISPHGVDEQGRTLLMMLTHEYNTCYSENVADQLLSVGVDVLAKDAAGKTAAMWAEERGLPKLAQRLQDAEKAAKAKAEVLP